MVSSNRITHVCNTKRINLSVLCIATMALCSICCSLIPQTLLSTIILIMCVGLLLEDNLYLAYPFMIFYYQFYGKLMGISVYRLFTFLLIFNIFTNLLFRRHWQTTKRSNLALLIPFLIYLFYALLITANRSFQSAFFDIVDTACAIAVANLIVGSNPRKTVSFFKTYVIVALIAFVSGFFNQNLLITNSAVRVFSRYNATFEDPNYMGLFYTLAIFALLTLKLFNPQIRYFLIAVLYLMIFASVSISAIVVNGILWLVYLFIFTPISIKKLIILLVIISILFCAYTIGLQNTNFPIFGALSYRIDSKLEEALSGDIDAATTGRSELTEEHYRFFLNQSPLKKLFGGTPVTSSYISPLLRSKAAHNEYVDLLLNIGIIGAFFFLGYLLIRTMRLWISYKKHKAPHTLCLLMSKLIWLSYAFTLTHFTDFRFMLLFFL